MKFKYLLCNHIIKFYFNKFASNFYFRVNPFFINQLLLEAHSREVRCLVIFYIYNTGDRYIIFICKMIIFGYYLNKKNEFVCYANG